MPAPHEQKTYNLNHRLAAAAGAAAAHAFVAASVAHHDAAADMATGGVSHVD